MKWYEVMSDCGDGTSTPIRFRTFQEAQEWRDKMENSEWFQCDGDGSPVIPVDSASESFYHDPKDDE